MTVTFMTFYSNGDGNTIPRGVWERSLPLARKKITRYNSTQLNEHLWTQVLKHLSVHIYLVTIAYRYGSV